MYQYNHQQEKEMARKILITSGKGGVGKTTISANIGTRLAKMGYSVLIIDGDLALNNLDIVMGMENKVVYDISDITYGKCRAKQAVITDYYNPNLNILPSSKGVRALGLSNLALDGIMHDLDKNYDYILIDSPAGIDNAFAKVVGLAKEAIVVTTPHISAIRDADKMCSVLRSVGITDIKIVVNRVRGDLVVSGESISVDFISDFFRLPIIGVVPEDDEINNQLLLGGDVHVSTPAYVSFGKIAKSVSTGKVDIYDCTKRYRGLMGSIRRKLRKVI